MSAGKTFTIVAPSSHARWISVGENAPGGERVIEQLQTRHRARADVGSAAGDFARSPNLVRRAGCVHRDFQIGQAAIKNRFDNRPELLRRQPSENSDNRKLLKKPG
jgi:hypothetical protein